MKQPDLLQQKAITPDGIGRIVSFNEDGVYVSFLPEDYVDSKEHILSKIFSEIRKPNFIYAGTMKMSGIFFYPYKSMDLVRDTTFGLNDIKVGELYKQSGEMNQFEDLVDYRNSQIYGTLMSEDLSKELLVIAVNLDLTSIICTNQDNKIIRLDINGFKYAIDRGFYTKKNKK